MLGPVERLELSSIVGKCLVGTNDEKSPRGKSGRDPFQDTFLQVGGKVGERDISAEHEVEGARRRLSTQILLDNFDVPPVAGSNAEEAFLMLECI